MRKHFHKLGLLSIVLAVAVVSGSTVLALPSQANAHAQVSSSTSTTNRGQGSNQAANGQANGQTHLAAAQLKACQNREASITNIITRIVTRSQNQLTLFSTIAARVEGFYNSKSKTVSNYNQLVVAVASAKVQVESDFGAMKNNSTFNCSFNNPKGIVTAFQGYLKAEITALQTYRTTVKDLIVAVASANGVNVSTSNQSSSSHGGQ